MVSASLLLRGGYLQGAAADRSCGLAARNARLSCRCSTLTLGAYSFGHIQPSGGFQRQPPLTMHCQQQRQRRQQMADGWRSGSAAADSYTGDAADLPTVGVLGGGQLGKMLAVAAAQLGMPVRVLDPTPGCPASPVAQQTEGSFRDAAAIAAFAADVDVLTAEIEHVDTGILAELEARGGCDIQPSSGTLAIIQDKLRQKQFFVAAGVPVPDFRGIKNAGDLAAAAAEFGFPFMLKSRTLAYDGKGNAVVREERNAAAAVESLGDYGQGLYAERWAPYVKELAVMVARGADGETRTFPVVETVHRDSICWVTEAPAGVAPETAAAVAQMAEAAVKALAGAGVFGVELFLLEDGRLLLNEVAPRPHNSGHYTIEACATSQYEQHIRAVLGWPLGSTDLKVGAAIMLNLLGEEGGAPPTQAKIQAALQTPGAVLHWYGKAGISTGRKVGHVTITAGSTAEARQRLWAIDADAADALEHTSGSGSGGGSAPSTATATGPQPQVGIIMGSDSDLPTMRAAAEALRDFGITCEVTIVSAHRTPQRLEQYARTAADRGLKVIIAGAGGAAHLPGMVAAATPLPVVGVPVTPKGAHLDGLDALLSIVQMPKGVPVATVAIGNAANAGLLAARILGAGDPALADRMRDYQDGMRRTVEEKAARLEAVGWENY